MNIYKYCRQILFARKKIFVRRVAADLTPQFQL